jgi:hypothetical protein
MALAHLIRCWPERDKSSLWRLVHPSAAGFAAGLAGFWAWGLSIAPSTFIRDHMRDHLVDRVIHANPLGYQGYPALLALWLELLEHTAWVLLPVGLGMLVYDLWLQRGRAARTLEPSRGTWLLWIAVTAIAFTIVDWRMTKHLIPLLLPLLIASAPLRGAGFWRRLVPVYALGFALLLNVPELSRLVGDFVSFVVTPAW